MKPTKFTDGFGIDGANGPWWTDRIARILPRRCSVTNPAVTDKHSGHLACDGRGFLYPDPPDDWDAFGTANYVEEPDWEFFCDVLWVVLGIVEDTE